MADIFFYLSPPILLTDLIDGHDLAFALTNNGSHVVVVVGYNSETGQLIVMDTETGSLSRISVTPDMQFIGLNGVR